MVSCLTEHGIHHISCSTFLFVCYVISFSLQAATGRGGQRARGGVAHMLTLGYRSAAHHLRDEGLRFMEGGTQSRTLAL